MYSKYSIWWPDISTKEHRRVAFLNFGIFLHVRPKTEQLCSSWCEWGFSGWCHNIFIITSTRRISHGTGLIYTHAFRKASDLQGRKLLGQKHLFQLGHVMRIYHCWAISGDDWKRLGWQARSLRIGHTEQQNAVLILKNHSPTSYFFSFFTFRWKQ